jgi:hypothetical protein
MPRFGYDPDYDEPAYGAESSSLASTRNNNIIQLSCMSPDGRSVHSVSTGYIETHSLPLEGTTDDSIHRDMPVIVRTRLPERVMTALKLDSAMELVCVEGDTMPTSPSPQKQLLPLLCLYTRKSVFMIQISYPRTTVGVVQGDIVSISEPLETTLLQSTALQIVRIRPAPQRYMGYACICPRASIAVLVRDASINEFRLILHHGNGTLTTPLEFSMEDFAGGTNNVCDFCFGQSNELALLATASIYLLQQGGSVLAASPILFHGAIVNVAVVNDALGYLEDLISLEKRDAHYRRAQAARCMLSQAFGTLSGKDDIDSVTAQVGVGGANHPMKWPVQLQGPVIASPIVEPDDISKALAIEVFFSMDLVGFVVAREGNRCDFCVTPPSAVLPRTTYEGIDNPQDTDVLNNDLGDLGAVVEKIVVEADSSNQPSVMIALVRDPSDPTMIHLVSDSGVLSFTTNAMEIFSIKVRDVAGKPGFVSPSKARKAPLKSTAFPSVAVSGDMSVSLRGAIVTNDAQLGHTMIARLSDGSMHAVNMTETKYRHESEALLEEKEEPKLLLMAAPTDEALQAVEATQPLIEILKPVFEKIQRGLDDGLTKIVGAATDPKDIDPGTLAVVLEVKRKCEKDVIIPLKELRRLSQSRHAELKQMLKAQITQLQALKESNNSLKARMDLTAKQLTMAEDNAKMLANRSNSLHHASKALQQTVGKAEQEYFNLLESLNSKISAWEETSTTLRERAEAMCDAADRGALKCTVDLDATELHNCKELLHGSEVILKACSERVKTARVRVQGMAAALGISTSGHEEYYSKGQ